MVSIICIVFLPIVNIHRYRWTLQHQHPSYWATVRCPCLLQWCPWADTVMEHMHDGIPCDCPLAGAIRGAAENHNQETIIMLQISVHSTTVAVLYFSTSMNSYLFGTLHLPFVSKMVGLQLFSYLPYSYVNKYYLFFQKQSSYVYLPSCAFFRIANHQCSLENSNSKLPFLIFWSWSH